MSRVVPEGRGRFYRALQAATRLLLKSTSDCRFAGLEHYPADGPYLIVFNHLHWLDLPVAFATFRHEVAAMAGRRWASHPLVGPIARHVGHAVFVQSDVDHRAMSDAMQWLRAGGVMLIAPEGSRSRVGHLLTGRPGAAYLASRTGVPIVPLAAWGHERLLAGLRRGRRGRVRVRIGQPFVLEGVPNRAKGEQLAAYTDQIMQALARLLPRPYRGHYDGGC